MFGFFTTQVTKGELRTNLKYLQDLQKKGKEVIEKKILNLGHNCAVYREITKKSSNGKFKGEIIGFEVSVVKGSVEMNPYKDGWQIHIFFPETPFLGAYNHKANGKRNYNYPKTWTISSNKSTKFTYRHRAIQISETCQYYGPEYYDYIYSNCKIYDCGNVYLLVTNENLFSEYRYVIEKLSN